MELNHGRRGDGRRPAASDGPAQCCQIGGLWRRAPGACEPTETTTCGCQCLSLACLPKEASLAQSAGTVSCVGVGFSIHEQ